MWDCLEPRLCQNFFFHILLGVRAIKAWEGLFEVRASALREFKHPAFHGHGSLRFSFGFRLGCCLRRSFRISCKSTRPDNNQDLS